MDRSRQTNLYRGLQFRLKVTRIRWFSSGTVHLEKALFLDLSCAKEVRDKKKLHNGM